MSFLVAVPLVLQLAAPLLLLAWLALSHGRSVASWVMRMVLAGLYVLVVGILAPWTMIPWYMPLAYAGIMLLVVMGRVARAPVQPSWPRGAVGWTAFASLGLLNVGAMALIANVVSGRSHPREKSMDLLFPLRGGTYLMVNAGSTSLLNPHFRTLEGERARPFRGQSYAADIVKLDGVGLRARGMLPSDPTAYEIFGDPVHAPCEGNVVAATDGLPDLAPPNPDPDRPNIAGNHVLLECGDVWVLLAHLQRGTVLVSTGEAVTAGMELGRVGNSGNTSEPHLHIHVQRPGTADDPLSGDPVPLRFEGTFPFRNSRVRAGSR